MSHFHQNFITTVIDLYGLELDDRQVDTIIETWLQKYDGSWIIKAIVESLYRGRYKIKSVDNILKGWQRMGKPLYNFTPEYEREILQNLPAPNDRPQTPLLLTSDPDLDLEPEPDPNSNFSATQPTGLSSHQLNPEESTPFQYHNHSIPPDRANNPVLGTIVALEERKVAEGDALNPSLENKCAAFIYVPTSLAIINGKVYTSSDRQNNVKAARISSQPVKLQLFHTLKAIVDPHNHQQAAIKGSSASDRHAHPDLSAPHHLPIEEQYL